jgi:hypothetical protein
MEVLVASLIGIATLGVIVGLVDAASTASSRVEARVDGTQRGRAGMEQVTQRLRAQTCVNGAVPIVRGDDSEVVFYADLSNGSADFAPERRRFYVDGRNLMEEIHEGSGTSPVITFPALTARRLVLKDVERMRNGGVGVPYFRFFAYDAATPSRPELPLGTPLAPADLPRVVRVMVAFRAGTTDRNDAVDTSLSNSVVVRFGNPTDPDPLKRGPQCL